MCRIARPHLSFSEALPPFATRSSRFEVDFVNLSYCNHEEDLYAARSFLDSLGMQYTKIVAKASRGRGAGTGGGVEVCGVWDSWTRAGWWWWSIRASLQERGAGVPPPPRRLAVTHRQARHLHTHTRIPSGVLPQIERKSSVRNFEGIANSADGIIISRGNLGLDFEPEASVYPLVLFFAAGPTLGIVALCSRDCGMQLLVCGWAVGCFAAPGCDMRPARTPSAPSLQAMALLQKRIIARCNQLGKPVLITRVVDTMVATPRPTRAGGHAGLLWQGAEGRAGLLRLAGTVPAGLPYALPPPTLPLLPSTLLPLLLPSPNTMKTCSAEATDVANAVLDGADGMLLGAETLRGLHPLVTAETVLRLCHAAEQHFDFRSHHEELMGEAYQARLCTLMLLLPPGPYRGLGLGRGRAQQAESTPCWLVGVGSWVSHPITHARLTHPPTLPCCSRLVQEEVSFGHANDSVSGVCPLLLPALQPSWKPAGHVRCWKPGWQPQPAVHLRIRVSPAPSTTSYRSCRRLWYVPPNWRLPRPHRA